MLTMGPVGYITQLTTHSKVFGTITTREGKALHAEKADTIFIFQNTQTAWQEALSQVSYQTVKNGRNLTFFRVF